MEIYAKGQLSYMILNCLLDRDFYGLDIITEIRDKSNGRIQLKKPSVYSNMTRMEKQGMVSSYMQSSDLGPNRRYYSITEKGRNTYSSLKNDFDKSGIDVFKDFVDENDKNESVLESIKNISLSDISETIKNKNTTSNLIKNQVDEIKEVENDEYFDFSAQEENLHEANIKNNSNFVTPESEVSPTLENNKIEKNETATASILEINNNFQNNEKVLTASSLNEAQDYNKRLFDISKEIKHVMKKRSFAEDQISIAVDDNIALEQSNEKTRQSIEEVKNSLLASKGMIGNERLNENNFYKNRPIFNSQPAKSLEKKSNVAEIQIDEKKEKTDNGIFITDRIYVQDIQKPKKIEPPRLKVYTESKNCTLPAPKRDISIDPSHKEIISRLYAKSKDSSADNETVQMTGGLFDYADLQDFYKANNITFKPYERNKPMAKHNTNKLYLSLSLILFGLSVIFSGGLFALFANINLTNLYTDFLFILLPALVLVDSITRYYVYKTQTSWEPKPMLTQAFMWMMTVLLALCIVGINFLCGLKTESFSSFATSLILPLIMLIIILPVRYYLKRIILVKFYK